MSKSEVQSLIALILGSCQVMQLLVIRHGVPFLVAALIAPHIVSLGQQIDENIGNNKSNQDTVSSAVARSIIYNWSEYRIGKKE
jgi:hypothetical protein